ncbi:MAG: flagellar biosynthetic protein FliR [Chloroflexi bacterium]|nr:flagellar biosynthetic protein FliR [Chloroflexota bacterium]
MELTIAGGLLEYAALVFVRLLSVFSTAPIFGHRSVPAPVRIGLAMGMTLTLLMAVQQPFTPFADGWDFLLALGGEVVIGLLIGFVSMLIFYTLEMAGGIIGAGMGLQFAASISPVLPSQGGMVQQFYVLFSILLFLAINGHHAFLLALGRTLEVLPPGAFPQGDLAMEHLIRMSSAIFLSAMQIALPVLASLMLTDIALALMNRVLPRVPVFIVGMPLKMGVGLVVLIATLPVMAPVILRVLDQMARNVLLIVQ